MAPKEDRNRGGDRLGVSEKQFVPLFGRADTRQAPEVLEISGNTQHLAQVGRTACSAALAERTMLIISPPRQPRAGA